MNRITANSKTPAKVTSEETATTERVRCDFLAGCDGDRTWTAPYDDTVLVMPSLRHLKPGNTQVRLGRYD